MEKIGFYITYIGAIINEEKILKSFKLRVAITFFKKITPYFKRINEVSYRLLVVRKRNRVRDIIKLTINEEE